MSTSNEIRESVFSAAVVLQAVQYADPGALTTSDPLDGVLMRYVEGELYYVSALSAVVRRIYAFVERVLANPARYVFQHGEQRIIGEALAAYEQLLSRKAELHQETVAAMAASGLEVQRFRWSGLNERFLALDN